MRGNLGTHPDRLRAITVGAFGAVFPLGILPIALAFGLTVTAMAYIVRPVSGAHLNPAVTVSLWVAGCIRTEEAPARSLGPAVFVGGQALLQVWLFLVVPTIAGAVSGWLVKSKTLDI